MKLPKKPLVASVASIASSGAKIIGISGKLNGTLEEFAAAGREKMGTKSNPGKFDCFSKAEPDEPMFVLLGRDPAAPILINLWADIRSRMGEDQEKVEEAMACAEACTAWLVAKGKHERFKEAVGIATEIMTAEAALDRIAELEAEIASLKKGHEEQPEKILEGMG